MSAIRLSSLTKVFMVMPPLRLWLLSAAIATLLLTAGAANAGAAHICATDALARAAKLLLLHTGTDQPISVSKMVTVLKPIRNPANNKQQFDVLAISGFVYKSEYRMRFLYAQIPGQCALVGQEILEYTSL